jgi:hypothetical protein
MRYTPGTGLDRVLGNLTDVFSGSDHLIQANTFVVPEKQITAVSCHISSMLSSIIITPFQNS